MWHDTALAGVIYSVHVRDQAHCQLDEVFGDLMRWVDKALNWWQFPPVTVRLRILTKC